MPIETVETIRADSERDLGPTFLRPSESSASPSDEGCLSPEDLAQVIARGDLALRAIRYRKQAAEFEAAASELEQAILLAKNGDPTLLQHLLRGESPIANHSVVFSQSSPMRPSIKPGVVGGENVGSEIAAGSEFFRIDLRHQSAVGGETGIHDKAGAAKPDVKEAVGEGAAEEASQDVSAREPSKVSRQEESKADSKKLPLSEASIKTETKSRQTKPQKSRTSKRSGKATGKSTNQAATNQVSKGTAMGTVARLRAVPSWAVSLVVHTIVLGVLGFITIQGIHPTKSYGVTASLSDSGEIGFETMAESEEISESEFEVDFAESSSSAFDSSASELAGDFVADFSGVGLQATGALDSSNATPSGGGIGEQIGKMGAAGSGTGSGSMLKKAGASFFGSQAEGNTFCFIVDSSGSMRRNGAFETAKIELMRTISTFKPKQRYYIYFFSEQIDRLTLDGGKPEKLPVYATPENLEKTVAWLRTIQIRGGKAPNDVLSEAIELQPDAIFLMFDGDTKVDVAKHLRKVNRVTDLISGEIPKVPIHTIGFNSEAFADSLRVIASENLGTYRFVPPPPPMPKRK